MGGARAERERECVCVRERNREREENTCMLALFLTQASVFLLSEAEELSIVISIVISVSEGGESR